MGDPRGGGALRRIYALISPAAGAAVMASGIVSVALALDGRETPSRILLVICAAMWTALGLVFGVRVRSDRKRVRREAQAPAALAAVVATEVLGTRSLLLGWNWAGVTCLVIAWGAWLALIGPVVRHWTVPTVGGSLLLSVSVEALAVLATDVADVERAGWLLIAALGPFVIGLGLYALVMARFDFAQLRVARGDHWVTGGALAICALAAAQITLAASGLGMLTGLNRTLEVVTIVLWCASIAWLPVLIFVELRWPRPGYDQRRWSTVFPLGMYSACSFLVGSAVHAPVIRDFGRAWVWVAVAVWLVVFGAMLHRGYALARGEPSAG